MSKTRNKFSPEVRERAVRMVGEHRADYGLWSGGDDLDRQQDWLHGRGAARLVPQEASRRTAPAALAADDQARLKPLEREVKELRRANEILQGIGIFCAGGARPPREMMMSFIDAHREDLGIEPICRELAIAPSSYHEHARRLADPGRRPARARRDDEIKAQIKRVHEASSGLYGAQSLAPVAARDGVAVAR
jgi:transposase-like protein